MTLLGLGFVVPALAQAAELRPLFKAGYDAGGDSMVTVVFTDGSTETLRANEGLHLGGGAAIINDARTWEFHLTLACKFTIFEDTSSGELEWTVFPVEALAFYRFEKLRLGGGLAYHIHPRLEGSGVVAGDVKFDHALGAVLQADWRLTEQIAAGLRYTILEYQAKEPSAGRIKANGLGVTFTWRF